MPSPLPRQREFNLGIGGLALAVVLALSIWAAPDFFSSHPDIRWLVRVGAILALAVGAGLVVYSLVLDSHGATAPADEFMPAREAVEMVNGALHATASWGNWIRSAAKDRSSGSPLLMGVSLLTDRIPVYGKPAGAEAYQIVDMDTYFQTGKWSNDLSTITRRSLQDQILYSDLRFKRKDLETFIASELSAKGA